MTDFSLRPVAPDKDCEVLAAIYEPYVLEAWVSFEVVPPAPSEMKARAESILERGLPYVVAEDSSGQVVGYAYAGPYRARTAYRNSVESSIYLAASAHGKGLAKQLMESLIEACKAKKLKTLVAIVGLNPNVPLEDNQSIRFHKKFGFRFLGVLEDIGHKFGQWTGTAIFQLPLDNE